MHLDELQDVIARTYGERDRARGTAATVAWLCEELGELAQAVRKGTWKAVRAPGQATVSLYDLSTDPSEQTDLADRHPDVVQQFIVRSR